MHHSLHHENWSSIISAFSAVAGWLGVIVLVLLNSNTQKLAKTQDKIAQANFKADMYPRVKFKNRGRALYSGIALTTSGYSSTEDIGRGAPTQEEDGSWSWKRDVYVVNEGKPCDITRVWTVITINETREETVLLNELLTIGPNTETNTFTFKKSNIPSHCSMSFYFFANVLNVETEQQITICSD